MVKRIFECIAAAIGVRLKTRPTFRNVLKNAAWLFGDHFLKLAIGLVVGVWVARYLGTADYGLLNYAIAFSAMAAPLATLGLQSIVVRDIVHDTNSAPVTLGTAFVLRLLGSTVGVLLVYVGVVLLRPDDRTAATAVVLLSLASVFQALSVTAWWFESQVRAKQVVLSQNIAFVTGSAIRVALILFGAPLLAFVILMICEIALSTIAVALAYHWSGERIANWHVRMARAKSLLSDGWPFMLSSIAITIYMKIDLIMLGEMSGNSEAGIYAAALRLSEPWYLVSTVIVGSAFPYLVSTRRMNVHVYRANLDRLYRALVALAYAITIPMTFFAGVLIDVLFGPSYERAGLVLAVHIWACHAVFLGVAYHSWITAENLGLYTLMATATGAVLNVAMNFLLIPSYGALGAAFATVIAYWLVIFVMPFAFSRTRSMGAQLVRSLIPFPLDRSVSRTP
jgi:polysaccharide transporter, PST family